MSDNAFDIVVYGASGFTGRLVAEYMQQQYRNGDSIRWAMGGRSRAKLESVRDEMGLPADTPLVVADTSDLASLQGMVASTRCVLTTVGPYQRYGSDLVGLCAKSGTDYVDLCGEPVWMRKMIEAHEGDAKLSGARIVFSCGFDSVPSDLGVLMLQELAQQKTGTSCDTVECRVRAMKGTFSGGTAASLTATLASAKENPEEFQLLLDPFSLTPGHQGVEQPDGQTISYSDSLQSWQAPFVMAAINTRNVHRSNFLMDYRYGESFKYSEMTLTGDGDKGHEIAELVANDKSMSGKDAPKPGEGPSKEERENGFYDLLYIGHAANGEQIVVSVKGDRDPGYGSTSKMISECAICLIRDATDTPGGIWTTAPAMGNKLIARLQANAGLSFTEGF